MCNFNLKKKNTLQAWIHFQNLKHRRTFNGQFTNLILDINNLKNVLYIPKAYANKNPVT